MTKPLDAMDPVDGLALVSRPISEDWFEGKTPEEIDWQVRTRQFWKYMFEQQLAYQAGDPIALSRALTAYSTSGKQAPLWLIGALVQFHIKHTPEAAIRRLSQFEIHQERWQAVRICRGLQPGSKRPRAWARCWPAASELLVKTDARGGEDTIFASYKLIQAAGGENATPESYKAALRRRRRKKLG
jgi:hypothetical protein